MRSVMGERECCHLVRGKNKKMVVDCTHQQGGKGGWGDPMRSDRDPGNGRLMLSGGAGESVS